MRCSYAVFSYFYHCKLILTAVYYFWRSYTTFDSYILLLTAIYHIRRLHITFDGCILLLALRYCDFARILIFHVLSFLCKSNSRLKFNINLLALIQFSFFCNSMVSPVNFSLPFWKRCFIRNTQTLKMWNFQTLKKTDLDIFNWIKPCYSNCNVP